MLFGDIKLFPFCSNITFSTLYNKNVINHNFWLIFITTFIFTD